jgi:hypothetical protein
MDKYVVLNKKKHVKTILKSNRNVRCGKYIIFFTLNFYHQFN